VSWRVRAAQVLSRNVRDVLPQTALVAVATADEDGYSVEPSDGCPADGRFEIGSITKTMTGAALASLADDGIVGIDDEIPPGYLGHDGGTSGFRSMLGIKLATRRAAAVFVNEQNARGLALAVRTSLDAA
jgi:hypothetical protein